MTDGLVDAADLFDAMAFASPRRLALESTAFGPKPRIREERKVPVWMRQNRRSKDLRSTGLSKSDLIVRDDKGQSMWQ